MQIDRGPSFGAKRYPGYAPIQYLDNMQALGYAMRFPLSSAIMQWNGRAWQYMIAPEIR